MSLRFTPSKDGRERATIVVRHRIDRGDLALAAALWIDDQIAGQDYDRAELIAATLISRQAVETKLRTMLSNGGVDGLGFANERTYAHADDQWDRLANIGTEVVDELYPEPVNAR